MTVMDTQNTVRRERPGLKEEIAIIPPWAFVLAAIVFVLVPVCFFAFAWGHSPNRPGAVFQILISLLPGTIFAFLVLMIGYVNRDAGRRGMSRALWTLIVIFVPNAIGFILYFLLRSPVRTRCPKCSTLIDRYANYCPNCRYSFYPTCPQCKAAARPGDAFCANCGGQMS
jgi:hypothetical protein